MQAKRNPSETDPASVPAREAAPITDVSEAGANPGDAVHVSPARALQARLVRELSRSNTSWVWHSTGLVLVAVLAMWIAGFLLNAQI